MMGLVMHSGSPWLCFVYMYTRKRLETMTFSSIVNYALRFDSHAFVTLSHGLGR